MAQRELTIVEKEYIQSHYKEQSAAEMAKHMSGIGEKTVQKFIDEGTMPESKPQETKEERHTKIKQKKGLKAGSAFARQSGVTAMTKTASEISDAKRKGLSEDEFAKLYGDRIHKIN
jgi:sRNA-binding protein